MGDGLKIINSHISLIISVEGDGGKKVTNMLGQAVCRDETISKLNHYQLKN